MLRTLARLAAPLLAAAAILAAAPDSAQAATKSALLTAYDVLTTPGAQARFRFKVERDNFIRNDLTGVRVDYWLWDSSQASGSGSWRYLGQATSAGDGYADLSRAVPMARADHWVAGKVAANQSYASGWQYILLAVRPPTERVIVTDIDWTIAAVDWYDFLWKTSARVQPVRGAVAGLNDLAKDATVVYLTARDDLFATKTRGWVKHWGFPLGPVICSDGLTMIGDPTAYKTAEIRALKALFANFTAGFGNKSTDHDAYAANGLYSYQWTTETTSLPAGALVYDDWEDLRQAVRRGERPELSWARFFR